MNDYGRALMSHLPNLTPYLTTKEVADLFRTTPEGIRWWRHTGKGPKSFKVGRRVLYARADVEAWLAEQQEKGA